VTDYVIVALAALFVKEQGPFDIFARLRRRVGIQQVVVNGAHGPDIAWMAAGSLAEGLMCVWCTSVWCAALLVIGGLLPVVGIGFVWFGRILAVSAGAILVQELQAALRGSE
jgi:hypothetical protein